MVDGRWVNPLPPVQLHFFINEFSSAVAVRCSVVSDILDSDNGGGSAALLPRLVDDDDDDDADG